MVHGCSCPRLWSHVFGHWIHVPLSLLSNWKLVMQSALFAALSKVRRSESAALIRLYFPFLPSFRRFLPGRLLWPLHHRHITPQLETKQDSVNYMVKGPTDKLELWDWNHPLLRHIGKKSSERPIRHMGSLWQTISNIMVNPALNCSGSLNFSERQKSLIFRCPCRRTTKLCPQWLRRETSG